MKSIKKIGFAVSPKILFVEKENGNWEIRSKIKKQLEMPDGE